MVDARTLLPPPEERNVYSLLPFKQALVAQFGVHEGFQIYRSMLGLPDSIELICRPLRSLREVAPERGTYFTEIFPAGEPYVIEPPPVIGEGNHRPLSGISRSFFVACLEDVVIAGTSELIQAYGVAARDFQGSERAILPEQLEVDAAVFHEAEEAVWLINDRAAKVVEVDEAFGSLLGVHSSQFGHWLWEYLPKYLTALGSGALPPVPVLIPIEMPPSHRQALELLLPPHIEIIEVSGFWAAHVRRLWCAPTLMYLPLLPKAERGNTPVAHRCFPPKRFRYTLDAMASAAERAGTPQIGAERLYLARKDSHQRLLVNRAEIEGIAEAHGFTILHPEELNFADQVRCVRNARFITGPEGSALFLMFFARPGTKLCHLCHPFTIDTGIYSGLLEELGADLTVFSGPAVRLNDEPGYPNFGLHHSPDYRIDAQAFSRFLDGWLKD